MIICGQKKENSDNLWTKKGNSDNLWTKKGNSDNLWTNNISGKNKENYEQGRIIIKDKRQYTRDV